MIRLSAVLLTASVLFGLFIYFDGPRECQPLAIAATMKMAGCH